MLSTWGKVAKKLGNRRWSAVDVYPQKATQRTTARIQTVYNPLVVHGYTVFSAQTFPQLFSRANLRYFSGFTHLPHTLLLTLLFIN